ncbi:hypothetical protein EI94DRAFT_1700531 [Lactarius quietus]|nr:hypothetical protein EI94DRAFT_1700531 [Lactarius quietus]
MAEPALSQPFKCGCKHLGFPAPSIPHSAFYPQPPPLWLLPHPLLLRPAQPTTHTGASSYATIAAISVLAGPSQGFGVHCMGPVWYPMPTAYPSEMYMHVLYAYWPYGPMAISTLSPPSPS